MSEQIINSQEQGSKPYDEPAWTTRKISEFERRAARAVDDPFTVLAPDKPDEKPARKPAGELVQLKLWPEEFRAAPNALLRSALFGVIKKGQRRALKEELRASWKGVKMRYTGWELDQADLDVWAQSAHISRCCLGSRFMLKERSFLRDLGRSEGGRNMKWLHSSLVRLQACGVSIRIGNLEYQGSLVQEFYRDKASGRYFIVLNPKLVDLFESGTTYLQIEERKRLRTPLAKWLQGYICSHKATEETPHRIGLEKLQELCGSKTKRLRDFGRSLKLAMKELQAVGIVVSWRIYHGESGPILEFKRPAG